MKTPVFIYQQGDVGVKGLGTEELAGNYPDWFADTEVCRHNRHGAFPKSREDIANFVRSLDGDASKVVWAVYSVGDNRHVGNISLQSISYIDRSAEIAFLFGEKSYWGKGYGFTAAQILIEHGFDKLNLRRIYCGTAGSNIGMQKLAVKLGMVEEGRRRQALFLNGEYVDVVEYGLLIDEWNIKSLP